MQRTRYYSRLSQVKVCQLPLDTVGYSTKMVAPPSLVTRLLLFVDKNLIPVIEHDGHDHRSETNSGYVIPSPAHIQYEGG
jgi:hypothetical protein